MPFPSTRTDLRRLLIALNTVSGSDRNAACRQAGAVLGEVASEPSCGSPAASRQWLRRALRLTPRAAKIADREERGSNGEGARIITVLDAEYPALLHDLELPPPVLYCRGTIEQRPRLAIVGSRRSDSYGLEVAELFACDLAARGLAIVSGLALGVDAAAHRGALAAGGTTIAVLGCGIDAIYPLRNRSLYEVIPANGALISEYPLTTAPKPAHFPVRNRIISALALGTLVVRATPRSGSLITARHALELGREVFAVPGNILDPRSLGPNTLIRDGAVPVQHPSEIIEAFPSRVRQQLADSVAVADPAPKLSPRQLDILRLLPSNEAVLQDDILARCGLATDEALGALLELELAGIVVRHAGPSFTRRSSFPTPTQR